MRLPYIIIPLLSFFAFKLAYSESPSHRPLCPPDQRDALLRFKDSFPVTSSLPFDGNNDWRVSWRRDRDCCSWDGISCEHMTGDVIGLDLSFSWLQGVIPSNSSLFSLRRLRSLNLAGNDFSGTGIPSEMSVFEGMTHLNLSLSGFRGTVPDEISRLSKLVSLDLSGSNLEMQNSTMRTLITNLTDLEELDLSGINMETVTRTSLMNFSATLTSLILQDSRLQGEFPDYIFQLPNLRLLDLSRNFLDGTLPESNWSSRLAFMSLAECSFTGEIPLLSIGSLQHLTYLDLSDNNFTGHFDFQKLSSLKELQFLGLSRLSVSGVMDANHNLPKLETLDISPGTLMNFPCLLSSMPELRKLNLKDCILVEVPSSCDDKGDIVLPQLEELDMENCNSKKFPSFLSQSNKVRELSLRHNMIKEIPSWFWGIGIDTLETLSVEDNLIQGGFQLHWKRLTNLFLQNNSFEGPLPTPPQTIQNFDVSQNRFDGSISPSICQRTSLGWLYLAWNNLTGIIPRCLGNLSDLSVLDLRYNSLTGSLPQSLVNCKYLHSLYVDHNNLNGSPVLRLPWDSLIDLSLSNNFFEGRWPADIFLPPISLGLIDLSSNKFEGPPPLPSSATERYSIANNFFSGEFSDKICNANSLVVLDMSNNSLTGTLPKCLKNITSGLTFLNLRMNELRGVIPDIFSEGSGLEVLDFSRNQFEGPLPRSLLNYTELKLLNVRSNRIADSFPYWLQALPLKVLSLKSNKFYGGLYNSQGNVSFPQLRVLDLSENEFDGRLPGNLIAGLSSMTEANYVPDDETSQDNYMISGYLDREFYSLEINWKGEETDLGKINVQFSTLDLSSNRFHGELPRNIGSLISIKGLNLSHNDLTGTIPPSLGNLKYLDSLDLSSNHLVGEIPKELAGMSFLGFLNLSRNNLTGQIPTGGHFNTFQSGSFEGNPGLCGLPVTKVCGGGGEASSLPPSETRDNKEEDTGSWLEWKYVAMGFGSGAVIGISIGYIVMETGRPLCLARMVLQLEAKFRNKPKPKLKGSRNRGRS